MTDSLTAFLSGRRLAHGGAEDVALALLAAAAPQGQIIVLDDATGKPVDLDLSGGEQGVRARYAPPPRTRGRPKLGVVAREVTLLPRHWDWLNAQPGGASVAIRKLTEAAIRADTGAARRREAAYNAMSQLAGNLTQFEAASRALFAGDEATLRPLMTAWPDDVARYILALLHGISPGNNVHGGGETL